MELQFFVFVFFHSQYGHVSRRSKIHHHVQRNKYDFICFAIAMPHPKNLDKDKRSPSGNEAHTFFCFLFFASEMRSCRAVILNWWGGGAPKRDLVVDREWKMEDAPSLYDGNRHMAV